MIVLITGERDIGKTTVCQKVLNRVEADCGGVLTLKNETGRSLQDIRTGEQRPLALRVRDNWDQPFTRFDFLESGFDFGRDVLQAVTGREILVVDEVGSLELEGRGLSNLFDVLARRNDCPAILVVRKKVLHLVQKRLNCETVTVTVTVENRDRIPQQIADLILKN